MKKSLFLLTAVAVAFFSCEKEQDITVENPEESLTWETISFTAGHETDADTSVKTVLNTSDGSVSWAATDKLSVVYDGGSVETSEAGSAGDKASFSATLPGGKEALFLVYPSSATAEYESSSLKVTVPSTQDGTFASAAIEVGQYSGSCSLKNLGGLLAITTTADVDEIVVHSNNSTPLAGKAAVAFTDGIPSVSSVESGSTAVTLSGLTGAGTYYAAVLPDSYDAGIYVELKNSSSLVGEKLSGNTLNVPRRKIMRLNVGNPGVIANKYFFKADGTGDGSSWDSPLGVSGLSTVLKGGSDATLFLAQGTYTLTSEISFTAHTYKIYGGYPADASGTSLTGRDLLTETAISGGDDTVDETGNCRIFVLAASGINLVADGITFKNAYRNSNDVGSALILNTLASASFNNCTIKNNVKQGAGNGGAVRIATGNKVSFTKCLFENNTCDANGGAINVSGNGTATFDNCKFINNKATTSAKRGGAIYGATGSYVLHLNKCYFGTILAGAGGDDNDSGNASANGGGAIWADSNTGTIFLNACSFYRNQSGSYASAIGSRGICGINNCAFQVNGNSVSTYPCSIQPIGGYFIVANTSIRLSAISGAALYPYGGTTYLVNNTLVNNSTNDDPNKGVALRSNKTIISYGHNVISKHYDTGTNYSVEDTGSHNDVLDYMLSQYWDSNKHCIYWTRWKNDDVEVRPEGFVLATPSRVEDAIDAFDTAASSGFKTWLVSLNIDGKGHDALETDIIGRLRQAGGASTIWPGCYERSDTYTIE